MSQMRMGHDDDTPHHLSKQQKLFSFDRIRHVTDENEACHRGKESWECIDTHIVLRKSRSCSDLSMQQMAMSHVTDENTLCEGDRTHILHRNNRSCSHWIMQQWFIINHVKEIVHIFSTETVEAVLI